MDRKMRRFRQQLSDDEVLQILKNGKVAIIALSGDDDYPYAVPVNYVYKAGYIYLHSARQGHKIDAIKRNPKCSVCIVDKDDIIPKKFTSYFKSIIVFGKASFIEDKAESVEILKLLCDKYSPGIDPTEEISKFINNVAIISIKIEKITGKQAKELIK